MKVKPGQEKTSIRPKTGSDDRDLTIPQRWNPGAASGSRDNTPADKHRRHHPATIVVLCGASAQQHHPLDARINRWRIVVSFAARARSPATTSATPTTAPSAPSNPTSIAFVRWSAAPGVVSASVPTVSRPAAFKRRSPSPDGPERRHDTKQVARSDSPVGVANRSCPQVTYTPPPRSRRRHPSVASPPPRSHGPGGPPESTPRRPHCRRRSPPDRPERSSS